jgi:hypothetical protein
VFRCSSPHFDPGRASYFLRAGQSCASHSHFFMNFAWNQDLSVEFVEQFKVACASECDQGRGI